MKTATLKTMTKLSEKPRKPRLMSFGEYSKEMLRSTHVEQDDY